MRRSLALPYALPLVLLSFAPGQSTLLAQEPKAAPKPETPSKPPGGSFDEVSTTTHEIVAGGQPLRYRAEAGYLPIRDEKGEPEAHIFYVAYFKEGMDDQSKRPLMFSFNGGPGSSSVWLHLGALGPRRVSMADAVIPRPPFALVDNPETWLTETDLVFIDPVGTGYSRAVKPELTRKFHGLQGDIQSVGDFIRLFLTKSERWVSPLYLVGESYGTTRAAGLAGRLVERYGIAFNGVILISSVLNFQTLQSDQGNDLPYALYLPTYTATAWYHKAMAGEKRGTLAEAIAESRRWAAGVYTVGLAKGDRLDQGEARELREGLARLTGLSPEYVERANYRIDPSQFRKELLRARGASVGRLDSRYLGLGPLGVAEVPDFDPSMAAIRPAYTATINSYLRTTLHVRTDTPYFILGEGLNGWDWGLTGRQGYPDTSESLQSALSQNPSMRVFIGSGYYDLATPFAATEYTLAHMKLPASLRKNFSLHEYEAGHMMYVHPESLSKLRADISVFLRRGSE